MTQRDEVLLNVRNLTKHYPITEGVLRREVGRVRAVDGISFDVHRGETVGLVGESGCGKSTAATTLLRIEEPTDGDIVFEGQEITEYDTNQLREFRRSAQMIFQDPTSSFDPRLSIGQSVGEPLFIHGITDTERRRAIVTDLLTRVGLSEDDLDRYPHEFSGGQKQRIALARAMVVSPSLIVADEPTSALDVSIQADILSLLSDMQAEFDLGIIFISHDLSVIKEICDRVAVMYLGEIVEIAETETLFEDPQHPYTRALLASIPQPDPRKRGERVELTGDVPDPSNPPSGCRFHTRCPEVIQPENYEFEQEHWRSVLDLRVRLANGQVDLESTRERVIAEKNTVADADKPNPDVTNDQLRAAIREEYGIPETLTDPGAERMLSRALDSLISGDPDGAIEILDSEFSTVCEERHPELRSTNGHHPAACLLHEESVYDSTETIESPETTKTSSIED